MLAQRVGQGRALVHFLFHGARDPLQPGLLDLVDQRGERLDQRDPGRDQGGQLPGGDGQVLGGDAGETQHRADVHLAPEPGLLLAGHGAGLRCSRVGEIHAVLAQDLAQDLAALRIADAADVLAGLGQARVLEHRHQATSSCVTLRTSATLVIPRTTLRAPSSISVSMPLLTAVRLMVPLSTFLRVSARTSSSISIIS